MVCKKFPLSGRGVRQGSLLFLFLGAFLLGAPALAQETHTSNGDQQSAAPSNDRGQDAPPGKSTMPGMSMVDMNPAGMFLMNLASGSSVNA
jgi:hypothetical protein